MPIAKPQFMAMLLRHMSELTGKSPRGVMDTVGSEAWSGARNIVDTMSPNKLDLIAKNFHSKESYLASKPAVWGEEVAFVTHNERVGAGKGGKVALPPVAVREYGPSNIAHEGRHIEQAQRADFNPIEKNVYGNFNYNSERGLYELGNDDTIGKPLHSASNTWEIDASLSEIATMEAAGDTSFDKLRYLYRSSSPEWSAERIGNYKKVWDKLPDWIKEHYRKTIGIAAPAIGAFQPETQE